MSEARRRGGVRAWLGIALVLVAGCATPDDDDGAATPWEDAADVQPADCSGHRHATFAIHHPDPDGNGLHRLDLAAPKHSRGRAYYQLGIASSMDVAVHMHQSGAEEGGAELGPTQMHYESANTCVDLARTLSAVDVNATQSTLSVGARHAVNGTWSAAEGDALHVYIQSVRRSPQCAWAWAEADPGAALGRAVANGQSFLVVFGAPTVGQLAAMQQALPAPLERPAASCP